MIIDYLVIGAGLSGLNAAKKINTHKLGSVLVLEKSRGVGGRMATRRTLGTKFDHGAQFYKRREDSAICHDSWAMKNLTHHWFTSNQGEHWCASLGMTSLAKSITENLKVKLEKQVASISFENNLWKVESDNNEVWLCENLIITSPLPQTIKLLDNLVVDSDILTDLKKINYTHALVGLMTLEEDIVFDESGYQEFSSGDLFSIADQKHKGVSHSPALTVVMSPHFSQHEFDSNENAVINKIQNSITAHLPTIKIKEIELKKWRYCQVSSCYEKLFLELLPNLYLIGDAFGGASLLGALRSSDALCECLIQQKIKRTI